VDEDVEQLIERVTRWATERADVVALALVGSRARGAARPDSDVDLLLVVERPDDYVLEPAWPAAFGRVDRLSVEEWGAVRSLRVHYAHGLEVELGITSPAWASIDPVDPGTARVVRDGCRILLDRNGLLGRLVSHLDDR
jgi:uncharacterized protein